MLCHMFHQMRYTFADYFNIDSEYVAMCYFALLTEIERVLYDCCINSCMFLSTLVMSLTATTIRVSTSALVGDPDLYPWVFQI